MDQKDISQLIQEDQWMMSILRAVQQLQLPDWWVSAGFVRAKVWDTLHDFARRTPLGDIDVIYFDPSTMDEAPEKVYQAQLAKAIPDQTWSVVNQARMAAINQDEPYTSSVDALSKFPETASCVAVTIDDQGFLQLAAPLGIADLVGLVVRPSPVFVPRLDRLVKRQRQKKWKEKWPKLRFAIEGFDPEP